MRWHVCQHSSSAAANETSIVARVVTQENVVRAEKRDRFQDVSFSAVFGIPLGLKFDWYSLPSCRNIACYEYLIGSATEGQRSVAIVKPFALKRPTQGVVNIRECTLLGDSVIRQRCNQQLSENRAVPSGQQPRQLYGSHCLA
jgi:hypothetical protein